MADRNFLANKETEMHPHSGMAGAQMATSYASITSPKSAEPRSETRLEAAISRLRMNLKSAEEVAARLETIVVRLTGPHAPVNDTGAQVSKIPNSSTLGDVDDAIVGLQTRLDRAAALLSELEVAV